MILDLIPMPDPDVTEWMALQGYESAERCVKPTRRKSRCVNRRLTEGPNGKS